MATQRIDWRDVLKRNWSLAAKIGVDVGNPPHTRKASFQVQDEPTGAAVVVASTRPPVVQAGRDTPPITTIGVRSAWS